MAMWCKSFSAPNVTHIGVGSFGDSWSLEYIHFPSVRYIDDSGFSGSGIVSADFPLVEYIEEDAFADCENLISVSFGTGFTSPTEIYFGDDVFDYYATQDIDLILGGNVLPAPDLENNTWQTTII